MRSYLTRLILGIALSPLSMLWDYIYRIRRFLYSFGFFHQNRFEIPIISVGNLSFGGTGKTPMTLWLANFIHTKGKETMILTRGYQSGRENSHGILKSRKKLGMNPLEFGDEPLLLARRLKGGSVVLGKNRSENLSYYFEKEKPDVVLLDDGHQHLKLYRNLNVLLFDSTMPIHRYYTAPRGYLREGLSATRDADVIVFAKRDRVSRQEIDDLKKLIGKYVTAGTIFAEVGNYPVGVYNANKSIKLSVPEIAGVRFICVAAIASPAPFFDLVRSLGANVLDTVIYPDHHFFTEKEIEGWLNRAKSENALVLVTEKDIVKIRRHIDDDSIRYLEIDQKFFSGQADLERLITRCIETGV